MAPGLGRLLVKREAVTPPEDEDYVEEPKQTTLGTHIFGKHLHKVRITTPTTTTEGEGKKKIFNFKKNAMQSISVHKK